MDSLKNTETNQMLISSPQELLRQLFVHSVKSAYPDVPESTVTLTPAGPKFGDYQCNAALPICQRLKASGN